MLHQALIAAGADVNAAGPGMSTPVMTAVLCNSLHALQILLGMRVYMYMLYLYIIARIYIIAVLCNSLHALQIYM